MQEGISGKIAHFFINSKLTILLMVALMIIGVYSSFLIPREEEPQINVPMADVMVGYPGASPTEVESRVAKPLEKIISNIKGVEHVHTMAMNGQAMLIVQFYVGQDVERSYVKLYDELAKHGDMFPQGVYKPMVKTRSIDDVPMLGITLWSEKLDDYQLRQIAEEVTPEIQSLIIKYHPSIVPISEIHQRGMGIINFAKNNGNRPTLDDQERRKVFNSMLGLSRTLRA